MYYEYFSYYYKFLSKYIFYYGKKVGSQVGLTMAIQLLNFPAYNAPVDDSVLLRNPNKPEVIRYVQDVALPTSMPTILPKALLFKIINLYYPSLFIKINEQDNLEKAKKQISNYRYFLENTTMHYNSLYFPHYNSKFTRAFFFLSDLMGGQLISGNLWRVGQLYNILTGHYYFNTSIYFVYDALLKKTIDLECPYKQWLDRENSVYSEVLSILSHQQVTISQKQATSMIIDNIMSFFNNYLSPNNYRQYMFQKQSNPTSLRTFYFTKPARRNVMNFLQAFAQEEKVFKIENNALKKLPVYKKKNAMKKIKNLVKFPSLLIETERYHYFAYVLIQHINFYLAKAYTLNFNSNVLKKSLTEMATSADGQDGSFLIQVLNAIKNDKQLKTLFIEAQFLNTIKDYRLDILVFPKAHRLLTSRFHNGEIDISQFLYMNLLLEKLHSGAYSTYIFTVDKKDLPGETIDPALARRVDYYVKLEENKIHKKLLVIMQYIIIYPEIFLICKHLSLSPRHLIKFIYKKNVVDKYPLEKIFIKLMTLLQICQQKNAAVTLQIIEKYLQQ